MLPRALRNLTDLKDYNGCHATAADCPSPPLHAKGSIKGTMPLLTAVEPTDGVALNERGADAVAFDGLGVERVDGHEHACNMIQGVRSIYLTHAKHREACIKSAAWFTGRVRSMWAPTQSTPARPWGGLGQYI